VHAFDEGWDRGQQVRLVLTRPEVPFQNEVDSGLQALTRQGKHHREARIAQAPGLGAIGRADPIEERLFDGVLANERDAKVQRERASQRGLARAGEASD
jgi:hypothetical protein